jgi:hypothetical protein
MTALKSAVGMAGEVRLYEHLEFEQASLRAAERLRTGSTRSSALADEPSCGEHQSWLLAAELGSQATPDGNPDQSNRGSAAVAQ